ncbi:nucleotide-binding protein [Pedobacter sp. MR2016-19]|uniref:STING domain-containing protein n=1 Tax=Pedobacter sp. MR2016-19 TaxID=2780089 RepID=UPI001873A7BF|nr:STING domain-containing protein [Pedobacter sp. MR2016-19]MBE5320118.1 nucleotide-binding protein [Pedobacter sp. MR2016-19]
MDFKPRIFIGNSTENVRVVKKIKQGLTDIAECVSWDDAFDLGVSAFDNLISQIAFYDYAILIAMGDDLILSREKLSVGARDNVLFEFGLFAGGLGRSRVFYVTEERIKVPTDLVGISLPLIPNESSAGFEDALNDCIAKIRKHIISREKTFDIGFLPSTVLAYGYFTNFIEPTVKRLLEDKKKGKVFHLLNKKAFKILLLKFTILLPDDLGDNMFNKVQSKRLKDSWQKMKVKSKDVRDYDFSVDVSKAVDGELHVVDIPFTLNSLYKAIELYSSKSHIGKDLKENLLTHREILNFKKTLEYLIKTHAITNGIVEVEVVEI